MDGRVNPRLQGERRQRAGTRLCYGRENCRLQLMYLGLGFLRLSWSISRGSCLHSSLAEAARRSGAIGANLCRPPHSGTDATASSRRRL